jgi:hypothetical protein
MTDSLFGPHPGEKSLANLKRLCADELLDFAILKKSTIPADAITNGGVRIYDCRQLRAGPALPK